MINSATKRKNKVSGLQRNHIVATLNLKNQIVKKKNHRKNKTKIASRVRKVSTASVKAKIVSKVKKVSTAEAKANIANKARSKTAQSIVREEVQKISTKAIARNQWENKDTLKRKIVTSLANMKISLINRRDKRREVKKDLQKEKDFDTKS